MPNVVVGQETNRRQDVASIRHYGNEASVAVQRRAWLKVWTTHEMASLHRRSKANARRLVRAEISTESSYATQHQRSGSLDQAYDERKVAAVETQELGSHF